MTRTPPVDADAGQQELHALKVMALRHNMPKFRVRFFKHYQESFYHFIEDEDQPKSLQSEEPFLTKTYRIIAKLRRTLDILPDDDTTTDFILNAIKGIHLIRVGRPKLFSSCTNYNISMSS